ncbi:MAG: patatin-like phospholipase family protein [Syntrophobacterales bacterium]|jgi:NTE family protein|nr:patatin-like phospholipase family protein [Syntrophobacterales bacterium]
MSDSGSPTKLVSCLLILAAALFSCQSVQVTPKTAPAIALVLGGGSAKGFAHVGVIRILEQEKIPIRMIVGASVGSLIGGMYASNPDSFQLEWTAFKIDRNDILDVSIVNSKWGPVQGAKLEAFVEQTIKVKKVEDTKIPFYPVATDINTGETVTLEKGSLAKAIRASSAIPGIFVPVTFGNRTLVDGGVTDNVPCDIAKRKGADIVIAVNLSKDVKDNNITSLIDIIGQSANIMMHENSKTRLRHADVVIEPDTKGVSIFDFSQKKVLMEEGMKAARKAVPKIREVIAKYQFS